MGESELNEQGSPVVRSMVDESGLRSVLFVPLVKDGAWIGNITLFRREISPFDPSEIALCRSWKRMGHRLGFGVGVSLGYATVGMAGYEGRSKYTASGTAVNVAARLCDMAGDGEILLSARAAIAVEDDFPSLSTGEVALKGIREPVEVFRLAERAAG